MNTMSRVCDNTTGMGTWWYCGTDKLCSCHPESAVFHFPLLQMQQRYVWLQLLHLKLRKLYKNGWRKERNFGKDAVDDVLPASLSFLGLVGKRSLSFLSLGQLLDELHTLGYTEWFPGKLRNLNRVVTQFNMFAVGLYYSHSQYSHTYCRQWRTES